MSACVTPWYAGLTCDHIYADCPNRQRGLDELTRAGWDDVGGDVLDPHGLEVCGLCRWRHNQTTHKEDVCLSLPETGLSRTNTCSGHGERGRDDG